MISRGWEFIGHILQGWLQIAADRDILHHMVWHRRRCWDVCVFPPFPSVWKALSCPVFQFFVGDSAAFLPFKQNHTASEQKPLFMQYSALVELHRPLCCKCKYECLIYLTVKLCHRIHACRTHSYLIRRNMRMLCSFWCQVQCHLFCCVPFV